MAPHGAIWKYTGPRGAIRGHMVAGVVTFSQLMPSGVIWGHMVLYGAILLLICDTIAQLPSSSYVLPINAITSVIGAPVIIWLLIRKRKMIF